MAFAALRVLVDDVDQFAHRVQRVAHHLWRLAPGCRHQLAAHHQQAKVAAWQKLFDHDLAMLSGGAVGHVDLRSGGDVDRHALALVAVLRLEHHWHANFLRGRPGIVRAGGGPAMRHRHTGGAQQFFCQVFVLGNRFGHGAGGVKLGCLNAALARTPAKLHQAATGQAPVRNAARHGSIDDGAGAGPQALVFIKLTQAGNGSLQVKCAVLQSGMRQGLGQVER